MHSRRPINNSITEIDSQTWLVGERLILRSSPTAAPNSLWDNGRDLFYSVSEVSEAPPASHPLSATSLRHLRLVYDAGNSSAVWKIGGAYLKVKNSGQSTITREHVTLAYLKAMQLSFAIPNVLYHGEWAGRQYLILSEIAGQTVAKMWPEMDEATKCHHVDQVVGICTELGKVQCNRIRGLDGNQILDPLLVKRNAELNFSHENLSKNCMELGMDCSTFMFFHCDLGPGNLVIRSDGSLGVIDWEMAGFVPKDWIRTRFCVSGGLDLPGTGEERHDWRRRIQRRLSAVGYREVADEWMAWWSGD